MHYKKCIGHTRFTPATSEVNQNITNTIILIITMESNTYIMQHIILAFQHIPTVLYWIEILRMWRSFECSKLIVMFKKPVWDDLAYMAQGSLQTLDIVVCKNQQLISSFWNTQTNLSGTNNHATFKLTFHPHSDAWFEHQQIVLTMSVDAMWLTDKDICFNEQLNRCFFLYF